MMAESIVCALFWYGLVGWCTAELHRHSGFYSRYSGARHESLRENRGQLFD